MHSSVLRTIVAAMAVLTVGLFSGCLGFFLDKQPDYVPGTRLEIRETVRGEDYWISFGNTETAVFEAVLSGNGECSIAYSYAHTAPLDVESLSIDLGYAFVSLRPVSPARSEDGTGTTRESDRIPVRRHLLRSIVEADRAAVALKGRGGSVIFVVGDDGRKRIAELVEYADSRWPDKD